MRRSNPAKSYKVGGITYPLHYGRRPRRCSHPRHQLPRDTHLDIAETLEGNLRVWLTAIHPEASAEVLSIYAEEIVDQAFDAIHDLSMDIDATPAEC